MILWQARDADAAELVQRYADGLLPFAGPNSLWAEFTSRGWSTRYLSTKPSETLKGYTVVKRVTLSVKELNAQIADLIKQIDETPASLPRLAERRRRILGDLEKIRDEIIPKQP